MSSDSGKAPSGADQQRDATQDFRIEDMTPADAAREQDDALRGGLINRGDSQPTLILADQWTGLTADEDRNLA